MDRLWAPWRMRYIKYHALRKDEGCVFCNAARAENPSEKLVLYKTGKTIVLLNLYPYNNGHLLVAPIKHVPDLDSLTPEEHADLWEQVRVGVRLLKLAMNPHGFNIGVNLGRVAGAGIEDHVHVHVVPRWSGDTNFMPIIANTKVIPQAIEETYEELRKYVEKARKPTSSGF